MIACKILDFKMISAVPVNSFAYKYQEVYDLS